MFCRADYFDDHWDFCLKGCNCNWTDVFIHRIWGCVAVRGDESSLLTSRIDVMITVPSSLTEPWMCCFDWSMMKKELITYLTNTFYIIAGCHWFRKLYICIIQQFPSTPLLVFDFILFVIGLSAGRVIPKLVLENLEKQVDQNLLSSWNIISTTQHSLVSVVYRVLL